MKKTIVSVLIATMAMSASASAYSVPLEKVIYPETHVVTSVNDIKVSVDHVETIGGIECDTLLVMDVENYEDYQTLHLVSQNGNEFLYDDDSMDWFVGDLASVIFDNVGTISVEDDRIIKVRYSGWIEDNQIEAWVK